MCSLPNVKRMSTSFASASAAGVTYFDNLLLLPIAKQAGIPEDQARERVAMMEPDYLQALLTSHLSNADGEMGKLKESFGGEKTIAWGLLSLAGSEMAYYNSALLIAKYYSLGVTPDAAGHAEKVEHEKAFINMLQAAERSARASARAARIATGAIPVQSKLYYQAATMSREGDLDDKLEALKNYWASSAYSQTAVMLARN